MIIDTVVSHGDWFNAWGSFGTPSVYRILSQCRDAGIRKVYWRTFLGARAHYHSNIEPVAYGAEGIERPGNEGRDRLAYDLRQWDPFRDGVRIAHEFGMQISAWSTFYEETHVQLVTTKFAEEHSEYWWVSRGGKTRPTKVSFAYPEVRQYKLNLIQEQAAYGVDDVCLDFFRENHLFGERHHQIIPKQEVDQDGVCIYGYEPPIVAAYQREYGIDPMTISNSEESWVRFRAGYLTSFMEEVREMLNRQGITLSAKLRSMNRIQAPFPYWEPEKVPTNSLLGSFVDWPTWVERGLLDEVMLVYEMLDLCDLDPMTVLREARAAKEITGDRTKLMMAIWCYNLNDRSVADGKRALDIGVNAALQGGADGVVLWESTPIHGWGSSIGGAGGSEFGLWGKVKELAQRPSAVLFT